MAQNTTMQASDWLTYSHLTNSPRNQAAVRDFTVAHPETGGGLERYLKEDALQDEGSLRHEECRGACRDCRRARHAVIRQI